MPYKRTTKRINKTTRQITTKSPVRTRFTQSKTNSTGGRNKNTYSWSWNKNGSLRQTFTENRNRWITRRVRTIGGKPNKKIRFRKSKKPDILTRMLLWCILFPFLIAWWLITLPFRKR